MNSEPRDAGIAFVLPADWGLSPQAPVASRGVAEPSSTGAGRQRQAACGAPLPLWAGPSFARDALSILGRSLVFASSIVCLFGAVAVLARLL